MYCFNCGNKIDDNDKFCRSCGNSVSNTNAAIIAEKNVATPIDNTPTQPPYCTNCGKSVGSLKICPYCHLKTKKSYKKYCRYCGGNIENDKCTKCQNSANVSVGETIIRIMLGILLAFFYLGGFGMIVGFEFFPGITIFLLTLCIHIFIFRKKQIHKIKMKLSNHKLKKLKLSLVYSLIPCLLFLTLWISFMVSTNPSVNTSSASSKATWYVEATVKKDLINPESLQIHSTKIVDSYAGDDNRMFYHIIIDYSAQNGLGGFARDEEWFFVVVDQSNDSIKEISWDTFKKNKK